MEGNRKRAQAVPCDFDISSDISDASRPIRDEQSARTFPSNPDAEAAVQYLSWALEEIEKAGSQKAARHTRAAMAEMRKGSPPTPDKD